ncbi:hypothetical protein ACFE04_025131 [Oxalis oulophora]
MTAATTLKTSSSSSIFISSPFFFTSPLPPTQQIKPFKLKPFTVSAIIIPPSNSKQQQQQQQLYQPFRKPPSPVPPQYTSLDAQGKLDVLSNRLGLWYEYAPLIPALSQEGFTPPSIEESTGISGVEQNKLVVAAQVRDSLIQSNTGNDIVREFDTGGSELLYEIRLLSVSQRAEAARFIVENKLDAKGAQDLARAMKDFPRRQSDKAWTSFSYAFPGDCLSFMYYRQSKEHKNPSDQRTAALQQALDVAQSENAKNLILSEIQGDKDGNDIEEELEDFRVPVVRMKYGEVAEASSVVLLPVCKAQESEVEIFDAPWECGTQGEFGVVVAEKSWKSWMVLPSWDPVVDLRNGGVVVSFRDARVLPWKVNRLYKEEPILVVADRRRKEVAADNGFYLVAVSDDAGGNGLKVERGSTLKDSEMTESLGTVVLVIRPPKDTDDNLTEEDWE